MLKKRIIPLMLSRHGRLVKGVHFTDYRDVGDPVKSAMVYSDQDADELILLNIDGHDGINDLLNILPDLTKNVFMPLSVGGGINCFEDAAKLISNGADKIVLNSILYNRPNIITEISECFGVQSVVVSIDVILKNNRYVLFSDNGTVEQSITLESHVQSCLKYGVGEFVVQRIDLDGTVLGLDIKLAKTMCEVSTIPVVLASGCGDYSHLKDVFLNTQVDAVACGSLFNFSDSSPLRAKHYLRNYGVEYKK